MKAEQTPRRLVRDEGVDRGQREGIEAWKSEESNAAVRGLVTPQGRDPSGDGQNDDERFAPDRAFGEMEPEEPLE